MQFGAGLIAVAVSAVVASSSLCLPAQADEDSPSGIVVTKVLRQSRSTAKVKLTLKCPRHEKYSLSLELLQDSTPGAAPLDAYYTGTRAAVGRCTGHAERISLHAVADKSGDFAPSSGRLKKGPVDVVLGGTIDGESAVLEAPATVS